MKSPLRVLGRITFLLIVLVLLAIGGVLAWFTSWRADRMADLEAGSELVETSLGTVEVSIRGEGPAVLVLHDSPGGYDQAQLFAAGLVESGFQVIAPSRPGYLRTPLKSGLLSQQQGDLMIALLDKLGVEKVVVLAVGSGGPAALEMALRFPSRVSGLILLSAVAYRIETDSDPGESVHVGTIISHNLTGDIGSWLAWDFSKSHPRDVLEPLVRWTTLADASVQAAMVDSILADDSRLHWFQDLVATFVPLSPRESGVRNDFVVNRMLPAIPLKQLTVPTLIIHGALDRNVPIAAARAAAAQVPHASLSVVEDAGHYVYLSPRAKEVSEQIAAFIRSCTVSPAPPAP